MAELVVIAEPGNLHAAIHQAEKIEMARGTVSGNTQNQTSGSWNRGRGRFTTGPRPFSMQYSRHLDQTVKHEDPIHNHLQLAKCKDKSNTHQLGIINVAVAKVGGHWSYECPSPQQGNFRGGRGGRFTRGRSMRGRRGGRNIQRGRGRNTSVNASLTASGSGAPAPQPQVQDAAPVPVPPRPGN